MRRCFNGILLFIYLISISGAEITVHHCSGKSSYSFCGFALNQSCKCAITSESHRSACCHNHKISIKESGDKFTPKIYQALKSKDVKCLCVNERKGVPEIVYAGSVKLPQYADAPPDIAEDPLYILFRVFRI